MESQPGEKELREATAALIRAESPSARIVHELGILGNKRRLDIASITDELHGYEIKSASDSLARLNGQAHDISRVVDQATLVCAANHTVKAAPKIPEWWRIIEARNDQEGNAVLTIKREGGLNPSQEAYAVAQLMWRSQALEELNQHGHGRGMSKKARHYIWQALADTASLDELRRMALKRLMEQDDELKKEGKRPA